MANFGPTSLRRLSSCHPIIKEIMNLAIKHYDFTVIEGHRSEMNQNSYFNGGKSKVQWPNSKHNSDPSEGIDIAPWIDGKICWKARECTFLAGVIFTYANIVNQERIEHSQQKFKLRWGGDWNSNRDLTDQTFYDLVHFEIILGD